MAMNRIGNWKNRMFLTLPDNLSDNTMNVCSSNPQSVYCFKFINDNEQAGNGQGCPFTPSQDSLESEEDDWELLV